MAVFKKGHVPWNKGKQIDLDKYTDFGMCKKRHSKITKERIRKSKKENPTRYWLGKKRPDVSKFISELYKGKSYNERFGIKKADELKNLRKQQGKIINSGQFQKGITSWNKNKEWIEMRGQKHPMYGKHHSLDSKRKQRISHIKVIERQRNNGLPIHPTIGRYETSILDNLENNFGYRIVRQYSIVGYFIDGYCPALNLAIEIDESFHKRKQIKDIIRQNEIEKELGCKFIRINLGEMNGK